MPLPRLQLFEFNDLPLAPVALRESIVEALSRTLRWGRVLEGLTGPFASFLDRTGATEVLDLCSGAGGPAALPAAELRRSRRTPPKFLLTDLHPNPDMWAALQARDPATISFVPESVDATAIPEGLGRGRVRMIVNALHHLPPDLAGSVLRGACAEGPGVFVAEGFERNPLGLLPMAAAGFPAMMISPFVARKHRLAKIALIPVTMVLGPWDGFVSTLRVYNEQELRRMVAPLGDAFEWSYGTYPFPLGGRAYWFAGVRRKS